MDRPFSEDLYRFHLKQRPAGDLSCSTFSQRSNASFASRCVRERLIFFLFFARDYFHFASRVRYDADSLLFFSSLSLINALAFGVRVS